MISPRGASGDVVQAIRDRSIVAVASWALAEETVTVLRRRRLRRFRVTEADAADVAALLAPTLPAVEVDVALRDPRDVPVVASAVAGAADAIVTNDRDLLDDEKLRAWLRARKIEVYTPSGLLERLREGR